EKRDRSFVAYPRRRFPDHGGWLPRLRARWRGRGDSTLEHHATGWDAWTAGDGADSTNLQRRECDVVWSGRGLSIGRVDEYDRRHLAPGRRLALDQSGHLEPKPRRFLLSCFGPHRKLCRLPGLP